MEQEIDLREYINVLMRHWRWIVAMALVAAAVAFAVSSFLPPTYEAEASLVLQRIRTEVAFVSTIRTEEDTMPLRRDLKLRLEGYTALVGSPSVGVAVFGRLSDRLAGVVESAESLRAMVEIESKGDLIIVRARAREPQLAADIANAWAQQAEKGVNAVYGQSLLQTQMVEIQAQIQERQAKYRTAQSELETFLAQNRIPELKREIKYRSELIASYQQALTDNETALYDQALASSRQILSDYYGELASTERVLVDALALKDQFERTRSAPATEWAKALAFVGIQNRAFGVESQRLEVSLGEKAPATEIEDLDWLIEVLQNKAESLQTAISNREGELLVVESIATSVDSENPLQQRVRTLTEEMLALQAQLEAERAHEREVSQARDLAWETYQTIVRKLAEIEVAEQVSGSDVRAAGQATRPEKPVAPRRSTNTAIAGALGLMIGVSGAFFVEYLQRDASEPPLGDNQSAEYVSVE